MPPGFFRACMVSPLNVGRVMTPALAMTVSREAAIDAFRPELFYLIQIQTGGYMASQ